MKVAPITKINFEGYKPVKSERGRKEYEFNYVYDPNNYDCYLEIYAVEQDRYGNYFTAGKLTNNDTDEDKINIGRGGTRINMAGDYNIAADEAFAYRYLLVPKNGGKTITAADAGNTIVENGEVYNIVSANSPTHTKGGAMKLIMPDFNNVAWVYDDKNNIIPNKNLDSARKMPKNVANKIGGSLAGIVKDLEAGKYDNFTRLVTTPLFTDDNVSAHAYWNENNFQMAHSLGNINNYISLQKKLFAKGINLVSDGAFVNEGLQGAHFQHVLKFGEKSPYFYWFRMETLKDSPLKMSVFGKNTKRNVVHKLINPKYEYEQKDNGIITSKLCKKNYDPHKPTYIQIYDPTQVNANSFDEQGKIKAYTQAPSNLLEINNHNDTVIPYCFRIDPETYHRNVKFLNDYNKHSDNKIMMNSTLGTKVLTNFEYFGLDGKHEGGFETWDANPDIAKLNYLPSHVETIMLKNILNKKEREAQKETFMKKHFEVQDYAVSSAQYWSKKTNQILRLHVAQHLKNVERKTPNEILQKIQSEKDASIFPKDLDINEKIISNVINNRYELREGKTYEPYDEYILEGLMDVPLDSIEVGKDIVSTLGTPYISKRAIREKDIGVSRYKFWEENNIHIDEQYAKVYEMTDDMYTKEMSNFAKLMLKRVQDKLPEDKKFYDSIGRTTPYGKYVLPFLTAEIARFAVIKSVSPNAQFSVDDTTGEISYNYYDLKNNTSLLQMGIIADSPEDEAESLIKKLRNGISKLTNSESAKYDREKFVDALFKSIKDTSLESFKLSDMIVSRAEAGLDWRIDATKDIADTEALRNGKMDFETTWNSIIEFWAKFTAGVKRYHPDAYIAAEVTDEDPFFKRGYGEKSNKYSNSCEAVKKLVNEAGFTTVANYGYLFSGINEIFGKLFDFDGEHSPDKGTDKGTKVYSQMKSFLDSGSLESIIYSYTFAGNHDKCRALEGYALDMDMVYADLSDKDNANMNQYRKRAYRILNGTPFDQNPDDSEVNNYDYRRVNPLAIAKCETINSGLGKALKEITNSEIINQDENKLIYDLILKALKNISNGKFKGKVFEAEGFGYKDFNTAVDIVFDEMDYNNNEKSFLPDDKKKKFKKLVLKCIIDPAMSKLLGHTKFLVGLVGNPTLYGGDEYGSTGFEFTTKNITVSNRNITHEEWADDEKHPDYMQFVATFKNYLMGIYNLRKRPELEALNDGTPYLLEPQQASFLNEQGKMEDIKVSALLRQNPKGSMTLSLFNTAGINHQYNQYYTPSQVTLDSVSFNFNGQDGLKCGIKEGTKFVNAFDENDIYYTREENGHYKLKRHVNGHDEPITFKDTTLILYSNPSFTGRRVMYNPQYNIVSNPYIAKKEVVTGSKLALNAN